jgi:hypothetical protein
MKLKVRIPTQATGTALILTAGVDVLQLARRYASPQQFTQAIQKGEIWEGQTGFVSRQEP